MFLLKMMQHWNRLPGKVLDSPCVEVVDTWLDVVLWQPALVDPALSREVWLDDLQRSLWTSAVPWLYEVGRVLTASGCRFVNKTLDDSVDMDRIKLSCYPFDLVTRGNSRMESKSWAYGVTSCTALSAIVIRRVHVDVSACLRSREW